MCLTIGVQEYSDEGRWYEKCGCRGSEDGNNIFLRNIGQFLPECRSSSEDNNLTMAVSPLDNGTAKHASQSDKRVAG